MLQKKRMASPSTSGGGLIDVIVGTSIMVMTFLGIFGILQLSLHLVGNGKAKVGALALANEQMEFVRSLAYNDVGVVAGVPLGNIPQTEDIFLNNIQYTRRTHIEYVDDPADGLFTDTPSDTVFNDYKVVKVEVSWNIRGDTKQTALVSHVVPKGLETATPGEGIFIANVLDAVGDPVVLASVTIVNNAVVPPRNFFRTTQANGAILPVSLPTSTAAYEITITKAGFSTTQTYAASSTNPNPNPGHLTVVEDTLTSATYQIDTLSDMKVRTFSATGTAQWLDPIDDTSLLMNIVNTEVVSNELRLVFSGTTYQLSGRANSVFVAPTDLISWDTAAWSESFSAGVTDVVVSVYYNNGGAASLVPDTDLSGNSSGFTTSPIDISSVDPATYPSLSIRATLSGDTNSTPALQDWKINYIYGPAPLPDIGFTLQGTKTIGTDPSSLPIYKYSQTHQTDTTATTTIIGLEWDTYGLIPDPVHGLDIVSLCPPYPYAVSPGMSTTTDIITQANTTHSLLVTVEDENGALLTNADVRLFRSPDYDETIASAGCGQSYFGGVSQGTTAGSDAYSLQVTLFGYDTFVSNDAIDVDGDSIFTATMTLP